MREIPIRLPRPRVRHAEMIPVRRGRFGVVRRPAQRHPTLRPHQRPRRPIPATRDRGPPATGRPVHCRRLTAGVHPPGVVAHLVRHPVEVDDLTVVRDHPVRNKPERVRIAHTLEYAPPHRQFPLINSPTGSPGSAKVRGALPRTPALGRVEQGPVGRLPDGWGGGVVVPPSPGRPKGMPHPRRGRQAGKHARHPRRGRGLALHARPTVEPPGS